jgi:hypothetical protein
MVASHTYPVVAVLDEVGVAEPAQRHRLQIHAAAEGPVDALPPHLHAPQRREE